MTLTPYWISAGMEVQKDPNTAEPAGTCCSPTSALWGNSQNLRYTVAVFCHPQGQNTLMSAEPDGENYAKNQSGAHWNPPYIGACISFPGLLICSL